MAVADKAVAAGATPFAISGEGWCLSDWFENILIRVTTPENYNNLHISHKLAWTVSEREEGAVPDGAHLLDKGLR